MFGPTITAIKEEWEVISRAPRSFFAAVLLFVGLGWGGIYLFYQEDLDLKNDLIETYRNRLAELQNNSDLPSSEPGKESSDSSNEGSDPVPPSKSGTASAKGDNAVANTGTIGEININPDGADDTTVVK